jgi:flavin-dependent thymidylate synthase
VKPYAELLEFNQPNPIRKPGFTRIRDQFPGLSASTRSPYPVHRPSELYHDPERIMEFAGRWDYGPDNARKLGETSKMRTITLRNPETNEGYEYEQVPIIQKYISMGHESMIEMGDATFFIECSRVVSHELVRHRIASYQQESQRFVKYDEEDPEDLFYVPDGLPAQWKEEMLRQNGSALKNYKQAREQAMAPQLARYVLPNAMRTRLIMKTNVREWRHIIKLRSDKSAQPEMQELMKQIHEQLTDIFPNAMKGVLEGERGVR